MFLRTLIVFATLPLTILGAHTIAADNPAKSPAGKKEKIFGEKRVSFPLLTEPASVAPYIKKSAAFVGKPVRVYWQDKSRFVPEAGEMIRDKICLRVETPKS